MWWMRWILTNSDIWEALAPSSWRSDPSFLGRLVCFFFERNMLWEFRGIDNFSPCFLVQLWIQTLFWWFDELKAGWCLLISSFCIRIYVWSMASMVFFAWYTLFWYLWLPMICPCNNSSTKIKEQMKYIQPYLYNFSITCFWWIYQSIQTLEVRLPKFESSNLAGLWRFLWSSWQSRYAHRL